MSWLEVDGQPVKVWRTLVIAGATHTEPGTIVVAVRQGIQVAMGDGTLSLELLQPMSKKAMSSQDLFNSRREQLISGARPV